MKVKVLVSGFGTLKVGSVYDAISHSQGVVMVRDSQGLDWALTIGEFEIVSGNSDLEILADMAKAFRIVAEKL